MVGGAAVGVQGEGHRRKNTALRGARADGPGVQDILSQPHVQGTFMIESLICY